MYTPKEIETVLWNTFKTGADRIVLAGDNNGCYRFDVFARPGITLGRLSDMAQELYDSDLFDVTMMPDKLEIEYLNPFVLERKQFSFLNEQINKWVSFDDEQIAILKKRFKAVPKKYRESDFYKDMMAKLDKDKKLSERQFDELEYLIKNGKTKEEANYIKTTIEN